MNNKIFAGLIIGAFLAIGGCAHEPKVPNWGHHSHGDGPLAHHPQGVEHVDHGDMGPMNAPPPPQGDNGYNAVSYLTGCTGVFVVNNRNTGELLVTGRGVSTPEGMMVLGKDGRQTGKIVNAMAGQSLTFKPDCNCKPQGQMPMIEPEAPRSCGVR